MVKKFLPSDSCYCILYFNNFWNILRDHKSLCVKGQKKSGVNHKPGRVEWGKKLESCVCYYFPVRFALNYLFWLISNNQKPISDHIFRPHQQKCSIEDYSTIKVLYQKIVFVLFFLNFLVSKRNMQGALHLLTVEWCISIF